MPLLTPDQVATQLEKLPGWVQAPGAIEREFAFKDFAEAMSFVNRLAALAEQAGHHPDIDIRYNKVRLALSTHDAGGITEKDMALAIAISASL